MTRVHGSASYIAKMVTTALRAAAFALTLTVLLGGVCSFGQTLSTLFDFGSGPNEGANPQVDVVFDSEGNLYGTTVGGISGNGTVFELSRPQNGGFWNQTVIHKFRGSPDGGIPEGRVVLTPTGKLLGTTWGGGTKNVGTIFVADPPKVPGDPWTGRIIYTFGSIPGDGQNPNHGLLPAQGSLYGVTFGGGATGRGTVFQLSPPVALRGVWTETILHSFTASGDAAFPSSELVMDKNGNLYGTTTLGGANNQGAIFEVSPPAAPGGSWTETVIHSFNGSDGTLPAGRLTIDANGVLYGTTDGGGSNQEGTVFKLSPPATSGAPWIETVLFNFSGGRDGGNPQAGVTMDGLGGLYGAASTGGSGGPDFGGVIFKLTPPASGTGEWTETVLHSFGGPDGFRSLSRLVVRNGRIFGTTSQGGFFGKGTAFVLIP